MFLSDGFYKDVFKLQLWLLECLMTNEQDIVNIFQYYSMITSRKRERDDNHCIFFFSPSSILVAKDDLQCSWCKFVLRVWLFLLEISSNMPINLIFKLLFLHLSFDTMLRNEYSCRLVYIFLVLITTCECLLDCY